MLLFRKGYIFSYGRVAFKKLDDNEFGWWVCLTSRYLVETETGLENRPESEKPLYNKEGKLNRFGFKWTDEQVKIYYNI